MSDLKEEWSISLAGCGFMGIYYIGVTSCFLERFPCFIRDAKKIYGASAGALMAAVITLGIPLDKCCTDLMHMAREARKHRLGPLHPAYNLLQIVQDSLLGKLSEDAHIRASGKLCVSLTRVSDGKNLLVSQFDSTEELIQALICSCFVPLYCGVIPPTYRGVYYVDGAVSDNLPRCHQGKTITISPYAGESDLCPRASTLTFHEVSFNNVSIQVNSENLYRVTSTFFPPDPEAMAEICQNGYTDALRFLQENNLISSESPLTDLQMEACCERAKESSEQHGPKQRQGDHRWLNPKLIEKLPVNIQQVLCKACKETHTAGGLLTQMIGYLPKKGTSYLPFESARSLAQRVKDWIPDVQRDMSWLFGVAGVKQAVKGKVEDKKSQPLLRRCTSLPSDLNVFSVSPEAPHTSRGTLTWNTDAVTNCEPLAPSNTLNTSVASGFVEATTTAGRGWGLGRVLGLLQNFGSQQTSDFKDTNDPVSFSSAK